MEADCRPVEWIAYGSNAFNALVPFYADVEETPEYLNNTTGRVSTENFYWSSRLIAAMALPIINLCSMWSVIRKGLQQRDTS